MISCKSLTEFTEVSEVFSYCWRRKIPVRTEHYTDFHHTLFTFAISAGSARCFLSLTEYTEGSGFFQEFLRGKFLKSCHAAGAEKSKYGLNIILIFVIHYSPLRSQRALRDVFLSLTEFAKSTGSKKTFFVTLRALRDVFYLSQRAQY